MPKQWLRGIEYSCEGTFNYSMFYTRMYSILPKTNRKAIYRLKSAVFNR
jgi:hypothetical protein